jgi:anti-sigma B factor antagonist
VLNIRIDEQNEIQLDGRFDATQVDKAYEIFNQVQSSAIVNFKSLDYISSAGLGVLLKTQKRLKNRGQELVLKDLNKHIREIFKYAGFDMIFKII